MIFTIIRQVTVQNYLTDVLYDCMSFGNLRSLNVLHYHILYVFFHNYVVLFLGYFIIGQL